MCHVLRSLSWLLICTLVMLKSATAWAEPFMLLDQGQPQAAIHVDVTGAEGKNGEVLLKAGQWLAACLDQGGGKPWTTIETLGDQPTIVIARADQYPQIAASARLDAAHLDAFCMASRSNRLYLLGTTEVAAHHAVATLLHDLGFRFYNPSSRWWITPKLGDVKLDVARAERPAMLGRSMWYAYGNVPDDLRIGYEQWRDANRLMLAAPFQNGHSYGNIILRNKATFDAHPEYYALGPDGKRDADRSVAARKFCVSHPDLVKLVVADRVALLRESRQANPYAFMVSIDPSDGQGTCHCESCQALGSDTDRVIHLANAVARELSKETPPAWVGLYAYSSHRLPPTIAVEPNVYVQVAMGFNRTEFTLDQLIEQWAQKVTSVGLREYYSVQEWDWGLPGKMRGANVSYHERWIPFYAQRNVNAINSQINANWGGQTLGLYVASQMMWNPSVDVQAIIDEYVSLCFGSSAEPMRRLYGRFDAAGQLSAFELAPMFDDLHEAYAGTQDPSVLARLVDMMAYMVYVDQFTRFKAVEGRDPGRGDAYYAALTPLMRFAWQIRDRGVIHSYALARRLCNGLPLNDGRFEYWMMLTEQRRPPREFLDKHKVSAESLPNKPVWLDETQLTNEQIITLFGEARTRLGRQAQSRVEFSQELIPVAIPGEQSGSAMVFLQEQPGQMRVRGTMVGRLLVSNPQKLIFRIASDSRSSTIALHGAADEPVLDRTVRKDDGEQSFTLNLSPGEYRLRVSGEYMITVPADATLAIEASYDNPLHGEYSGGHFFYVPRGTKKLLLSANGRLSLLVPGYKRVDLGESDRDPAHGYIAFDVPSGADGQVWQTFHQTRGNFYFINIPPYIMPHRARMVLPRDLAGKEGLQ